MNDIERAEKILTELRGKREAAVAHGVALGEERTRLAFGAHALGDTKSRKRLDEINRESALHDSELRSLDCAISEATARVERARRAEEHAAAVARAEELHKHVDELGQVFPFLDKNLMAALKALLAIDRGVTELHQKGVAFPTDVQLRLGIVAVLGTFLQQLPRTWWNEIAAGLRYRAPGEKKTALSYWAQIEPSLRNAIRPRVGGAERTDTEAA